MDKTTTAQKNVFWFIIILVVLFIIGGSVLTYTNPNSGIATSTELVFTSEPSKLDDFAKCLTDKGWAMYGAVWCSHCKEAKAEFANAFRFVNYVECPDNVNGCEAKGIKGFPTWLGPTGQKYEGWDGNSLKNLASVSGCVLPK